MELRLKKSLLSFAPWGSGPESGYLTLLHNTKCRVAYGCVVAIVLLSNMILKTLLDVR